MIACELRKLKFSLTEVDDATLRSKMSLCARSGRFHVVETESEGEEVRLAHCNTSVVPPLECWHEKCKPIVCWMDVLMSLGRA